MFTSLDIKNMDVKNFSYETFDEAKRLAFVESNPKPVLADAVVAEAEQVVELPPEPTFSMAELEAAKMLAKEEGLAEGFANAQKAFDEKKAAEDVKTAELLAALQAEIGQINEAAEENKTYISASLAALAGTLAKKICENIPESDIVAALEKAIKQALKQLDNESGIKLVLNPKNFEQLNNKFTGIDVSVAEDVKLGDFRIKWQNGYLEKDTAKIWAEIENLLQVHFAKSNNENNNNEVENGSR